MSDYIDPNYPDSQLTGKIIGCAMEVHRVLGNGFQEVVYQRALSIEMDMNNLLHEREKTMQLKYKGHDVGTRRVDFFVMEKVVVANQSHFRANRPGSCAGDQLS